MKCCRGYHIGSSHGFSRVNNVTDASSCWLYKAAVFFVCLSGCLNPPPPIFFSTRPSDRNQIWHTYSGRYGTHSQLFFYDPAHPRGNITSYVDVIERRVCEAFKNYRSTFDDVILRSVGGLIGDFAPSPPLPSPPLPSPSLPSLQTNSLSFPT